MGSICKHHQWHEPVPEASIRQLCGFLPAFRQKAVDAKLAKETSYGELAEIEALCNYEGKDFNLKMIRINNDIREQKYEAAATQIDAMIADTTVNQQELISRLKFIAVWDTKQRNFPNSGSTNV